MERPKLLVAVEAQAPLRLRIATALEADGMSIAPNGAAGPAEVRVVAVDLSQRVSRERLRAVLSNGSAGRIVAVCPSCGPLGLRRAVRAGADSLVLEPELENALAAAVRAVAAGLSAVPALLGIGAERVALSHREREVLRLAVTGHTNGEIASALFLAESTVKSHLSSAYRELGAAGRSEAASMIFDPSEGLADVVLGHNTAHRMAGEGHIA